MKNNWPQVRLGDAPLTIIDGDRGKNYPSHNDFFDDEYCLFLNTKNVRQGGFDFSACQYITQERDQLLRKGKLSRNDLILTTRGTIGNIAFYDETVPFENVRINSGMVIIRPNTDKLDPGFNFYLFRKLQEDFYTFTTGSAQPQLPIKDLSRLLVSIPPLPTQRAIAATLSCLDDKIELNERINANLEAQAQAIFKSAFVDFEPFQDGKFVGSELGKIPEGWRVGRLGDLGDIIGGATPSKAKNEYFTNSETGIAWITPKDLSINKYKFISHGELDITNIGYKNCSTKLIPKDSVLFSSRAPIGYITIANNELCTNQGFKSIVPNSNIGTDFIYFFLKNNLATIESHATGSVFKEVSGTTMKNINVIIPDDESLGKFKQFCGILFEQQSNIEKVSRTLAAIRDTLLPKLMSGEIEVEEES
jgi:type I restriction enzyme S subunit